MRENILTSLRVTVATLVLLGVLYPLAVTGVARVVFPYRAGGTIVLDGSGKPVGSELLGQGFSSPAYFQPRPSAAGEKGWDPMASGGSNFGPTSVKLRERAAADVARLRAENPSVPAQVPAELVTASGSGLDPHLSPAGTLWQVARIAGARGVSEARVRALVQDFTEGRELGFLGEPRVNVLLLNVALDRQFGRPVARSKG
jgi:potassium-transporting ATPase KdpC subunit